MKFRPGKIAGRLATYVILFSSMIAGVITAVELGSEYIRDLRGIDSRMEQIKVAYLDSIIENVWVADKERIDTLLIGITRLPDFVMAEVQVEGKTFLHQGRELTGDGLTRTFPLQRMHRGQLQNIGELIVSASYESAYNRVLDRLLFFLAANGGKTLVVAIFIFIIFYLLVGRQIEQIALHILNFSLEHPYQPMKLSRTRSGAEDEIQKVEDAYNQMAQRLFSYREAVRVREADLNRLNVDLELKSIEQRATAEALRLANVTLEDRIEQRTSALKASENRLRMLSRAVEQSPNTVFITNTNGYIEYVNSNFYHLTGYLADEALGKTPSILKSGETPPEVYKDLWATILAGHEWRGELMDRHKDGHLFWVSVLISPVRDDHGAVSHFVSVHEDITERKRSEDQIRRERDLRQSVIDCLPGVFYVIGQEGRFIMWNQNVETVTGLSAEELAHASPLQFFEGSDLRQIEESLTEVFKDGKSTAEAVLVSKDGRRTPFYFSGIRSFFDGRPCVVGTGIDITERRESELAVKKAKDQAEIANRTKSEFLANMSHELRTPLNAIIGFSDVMQNESFGPLNNQKYKSYSHDINKSGLHLLELINDILDVSAIEAGKLELREEDLDISQIVESVFRLIGPKAESNGIKLISNFPSPPPVLRADPRRTKQIILNLLSNAIKFSPKNDTITIAVISGKNGGLSISVNDNGIGMNKEEIQLAMMPFGRTKHAYIRNIEGTGLGLPLCNSLIMAHGGTLDIDSTPGLGTTVTVRFPAERVVHLQ